MNKSDILLETVNRVPAQNTLTFETDSLREVDQLKADKKRHWKWTGSKPSSNGRKVISNFLKI